MYEHPPSVCQTHEGGRRAGGLAGARAGKTGEIFMVGHAMVTKEIVGGGSRKGALGWAGLVAGDTVGGCVLAGRRLARERGGGAVREVGAGVGEEYMQGILPEFAGIASGVSRPGVWYKSQQQS